MKRKFVGSIEIEEREEGDLIHFYARNAQGYARFNKRTKEWEEYNFPDYGPYFQGNLLKDTHIVNWQ